MEKKTKRRNHLFDAKTIASGLLSKHTTSDEYIKKKIHTTEQVLKLLTHLKELVHPTFLDYQLAQLISDAAHCVSIDLGTRVVLSQAPAIDNKEGQTESFDQRDNQSQQMGLVYHDGGPNQFSHPGCEIACTIISLIFALLYMQNSDSSFKEFAGTIDWSVVMRQSKLIFKAWRRICDEKLQTGKIRTLPPYPTIDEIWMMPHLKNSVSPYVTVDKSGYYKTQSIDDDGLESLHFIPFKDRLKRLDTETKQRKVMMASIVTSISLTICIISIYIPLTGAVRYVIYDPHGTFILHRETSHYAVNFRNEGPDKKAFLVEFPSLECLLDNMDIIPFCALQEAITKPTKYTIATITRETFDY